MALTGKPSVTSLQVGNTLYWTNGGTINSGVITKVVVRVTNPAADSTGVQDVTYMVGTVQIPGSQGFHSKNALLYSIKGTYLNDFTGAAFGSDALTKGTSNDYSYSKFNTVDLSGTSNLAGVVLDGCNFTGADLTSADLTGCSMKYAVLTGANLTSADMAGANLYGATLPTAADSKSEFKALVADYTGTIWTDGTVVT